MIYEISQNAKDNKFESFIFITNEKLPLLDFFPYADFCDYCKFLP